MDTRAKQHLAATLAYYEERRKELDAMISALRRELGVANGKVGKAVENAMEVASIGHQEEMEIQSDTFFQMKIPEAARKYLAMVKQTQTVSQIADTLHQGGLKHTSTNFAATVSSILSRDGRRENGTFVNVARGQWGLREWYKGRKKNQIPAKRKDVTPRKKKKS